MIEERKEESQYAKDIRGKEIYIDDAESGLNGYYCIGCGHEMVACISQKISSYFRHHATDVSINRQCTFSNETYRHKVAKEILQRIKRIRVPAVYKYPPKGQEGVAIRLKAPETIEASTVGIEYRFYENEQGEIRWMNNPSWTDGDTTKNLIVQPDITFFNNAEYPILFIEIVVTHKPDNEKLVKLKRLGVNTVSVTLPKASFEEIEETFSRTDRTKWLYNNEEDAKQYVRVSGGNSEGLPPPDKLQKRLFEESSNCRAAEIGNIIRAIERCLESEQYRTIRQHLEEEVSRVTDNAERSKGELLRLQASFKKKSEKPFRGRSLKIEQKERKVRSRHKHLARRYSRKTSELAQREGEYRPDCQDEIERIEAEFSKLGSGNDTIQERREEIRREEADIDRRIEVARIATADLRLKIISLPDEFREIEGRMVGSHQRQEDFVGTSLDSQEAKLEEEFERDRIELRERHEKYRDEAARSVENSNNNRSSRLSSRVGELVEARRLIVDTTPKYGTYARLRAAHDCFKSRAYKDWL